MPVSVFITLLVIMLGLTKLYMWLFSMEEPIYAIGAAALTLIALYLALLPGMKKRAQEEEKRKAEAEKKAQAVPAFREPSVTVPKDDSHDMGTDEAFMAAFTASMIYHEIHGHHRSRKERDYDGNWDAPDDDSYYADPYEEDRDDDLF